MEEKQIDNLRRLARSAFAPDGSLRPFDEQVRDYAFGELPESEVLIVSSSTKGFGLPIATDEPLVLSQRNLKKIQFEHDITLKELSDLPKWLEQHPLALESLTMRDALAVFADAQDVHGNEILIALHVARERGQRAYEIVVDEIASVYGKENLDYLIENTARAGKNIYVNENTKSWFVRTGVPFPALETSSVINEYTLERIESQVQFDSVTASKEKLRAPEDYEGFWWSPAERIAFYADPAGEKEPETWQGVDAARLSVALADGSSPALVAQALGAADFDGRPPSALKRVKDWEAMPESHDELAEWKERVEERIDLSTTQPEQGVSAEKAVVPEEKKLPAHEKLKFAKKMPGFFNRGKATARQDESRVQSQARGDDKKRPTRTAERDQ